MSDAKVILSRFESLGDNCEFGFVQRKYGFEAGGLLRWAISPVTELIAALDKSFEDFYLLNELEPSSDDMVLASRYGLNFHSALRSTLKEGVRQFTASPEERQALYDMEIEKINHMRVKLLERLASGEFIFVYKANRNISEDNARALLAALRRHNVGNQLLVVVADETLPPTLILENGLFLGTIERFAPYHQADDAVYERWLEVCGQTCALSDFAIPRLYAV